MKLSRRTTRTAKDLVEGSKHVSPSRRDFIKQGLATVTVATTGISLGSSKASAANNPTCPAQTRAPGALAQIFRSGGNSRGAMFLSSQQVNAMNATMAANYGITGAKDIVSVGSNYYMSQTSPYAMAVMTPPAGYTQAQWNAVLAKTSMGAIYGPWNADDGAGAGQGNLGSASPWKSSLLGKDIRIANVDNIVGWGGGTPAINLYSGGGLTYPGSLSASSIANLASLTPSGVLNSAQIQASASAAFTLSSVFNSALGLSTRTGATQAVTKTYCGFAGNSVLADPTFGPNTFNPNNIAALTSKMTVSKLSPEQQGLLGSFYASAVGNVGAVLIEQQGNDYHSQAASVIAPQDYEAGTFLQMFLAACDAAQTPGAFIEVSNGNNTNSGVQSFTLPTGQSTQAPTAAGDSGGSYNVGFIICYNPSTAPKLNSVIGSLNTGDGSIVGPSNITTVPVAMSWLYLTAFQYIGANVSAAFSQMTSNGVLNGTSPSAFTLLG